MAVTGSAFSLCSRVNPCAALDLDPDPEMAFVFSEKTGAVARATLRRGVFRAAHAR